MAFKTMDVNNMQIYIQKNVSIRGFDAVVQNVELQSNIDICKIYQCITTYFPATVQNFELFGIFFWVDCGCEADPKGRRKFDNILKRM